MIIYLLYTLIFIFTIILFTIVKDKKRALKLIGILTLSSSILLITLTFIAKLIIQSSITFINVKVVTNYLYTKFIYTSLILFITGIIEIIISKNYKYKKIIEKTRYHNSNKELKYRVLFIYNFNK